MRKKPDKVLATPYGNGIFERMHMFMGFENAPNVELEYKAEGHESVTAVVDHQPIIGKSAEMAQRADLYKAALAVKPENISVAIEVLKSLS